MSAHAFSSSGALPTVTASGAERGGRGDLLAVVRGRPMRHHSAVLPTLTTKSSHRQQNASGDRVSLQQRVHLLPTPTATMTVKGNYNRAGSSPRAGDGLATRIGAGPLNPQWLEWLMGFPDGWTENVHSGTQSSRSARKSSGT